MIRQRSLQLTDHNRNNLGDSGHDVTGPSACLDLVLMQQARDGQVIVLRLVGRLRSNIRLLLDMLGLGSIGSSGRRMLCSGRISYPWPRCPFVFSWIWSVVRPLLFSCSPPPAARRGFPVTPGDFFEDTLMP